MNCEYADCKTENHKNHIVKYGFYDGLLRSTIQMFKL